MEGEEQERTLINFRLHNPDFKKQVLKGGFGLIRRARKRRCRMSWYVVSQKHFPSL